MIAVLQGDEILPLPPQPILKPNVNISPNMAATIQLVEIPLPPPPPPSDSEIKATMENIPPSPVHIRKPTLNISPNMCTTLKFDESKLLAPQMPIPVAPSIMTAILQEGIEIPNEEKPKLRTKKMSVRPRQEVDACFKPLVGNISNKSSMPLVPPSEMHKILHDETPDRSVKRRQMQQTFVPKYEKTSQSYQKDVSSLFNSVPPPLKEEQKSGRTRELSKSFSSDLMAQVLHPAIAQTAVWSARPRPSHSRNSSSLVFGDAPVVAHVSSGRAPPGGRSSLLIG